MRATLGNLKTYRHAALSKLVTFIQPIRRRNIIHNIKLLKARKMKALAGFPVVGDYQAYSIF
ncbi:hypothetical protein ACP26F_18125 [Franconibacter pulveris 1160]|uniref:hypothetical protein n=1 Tax=Franconibacter pulveris TaxID=435910 RepID=UPI0004639934|nr:hypothetical protein [Franconibacter pulveris]